MIATRLKPGRRGSVNRLNFLAGRLLPDDWTRFWLQRHLIDHIQWPPLNLLKDPSDVQTSDAGARDDETSDHEDEHHHAHPSGLRVRDKGEIDQEGSQNNSRCSDEESQIDDVQQQNGCLKEDSTDRVADELPHCV